MKLGAWKAAVAAVAVVVVGCSPPASGRVVTTIAGTPGVFGSADGVGSAASFRKTYGAAVDTAGNVYVVDSDRAPNAANNTVRKVTPGGVVTTFAGTAGQTGSIDGTGAAASFNNPQGISIDRFNNVYLADTGNHTIRKITSSGVVSTMAGSPGVAAHVDGTGVGARFYFPYGVAVDDALNVYVVGGDDTVRKVTPAGVVTTLAGVSMAQGTADGAGAAARFNEPWGIASTGAGTLFIADQRNHTIRRVTNDGIVTTVAGMPGVAGSSDGTGSGAAFREPTGIALGNGGDLYVTDMSNHTIRMVTQAGAVTAIAGVAGESGATDGESSLARFRFPVGIATTTNGTLYVADSGSLTIRKIG